MAGEKIKVVIFIFCIISGQTEAFHGLPKSIQTSLVQWSPLSYSISLQPHAGSGVVRIDPLCFLTGCLTRRL